MWINFLFIFLFIGINAFFVAVEYAAVASRKSRLEVIAEKETPASRIVKDWLENPSARNKLIAADQVAITLVNLAVGAVSENTFTTLLMPLFDLIRLPEGWNILRNILNALPVILGLIIATGLQVVFGELVPKVAVLREPEKFALASAPIINVFIKIFNPFIQVLDGMAKGMLKLIGISENDTGNSAMTVDEMKVIFSGSDLDGVIEKQERDMLTAVIDFGGMVVRQVSIPRTEIVAVEADAGLDEMLHLVSQSHVTKLPVYEDNIDQILGILHIRDLIDAIQKEDRGHITARSLMREALFIPETISVNELLYQFRNRKQHMAIVLDEFGGTSGIVTLEDLVEEIVGDYRDSFESAPPQIETLPDGAMLVDGLTLITDINHLLQIELADPDYDTIAGYMLGKLERIPRVGDTVELPEYHIQLVVMSMDRLRISRIKILFTDQDAQPDGEPELTI